jgi:hypothetical protein
MAVSICVIPNSYNTFLDNAAPIDPKYNLGIISLGYLSFFICFIAIIAFIY